MKSHSIIKCLLPFLMALCAGKALATYPAVCEAPTVYFCIAEELATQKLGPENASALMSELNTNATSIYLKKLLVRIESNSSSSNPIRRRAIKQPITFDGDFKDYMTNKQLDLDTKSDDALSVSAFMQVYRSSLLQVLPDVSQQLKMRFNETIAKLSIEDQAKHLTDVALVEVYSGDINAAQDSIRHAALLTPDESRVVLVSHVIKETKPVILKITKQTGFQTQTCDNSNSKTAMNFNTILGKDYQVLDRVIGSIPDVNLKIKSYLLLASYLEQLNPCHLQHEFFKYRSLQTFRLVEPLETRWQLGLRLMKGLRRYFKT